MQVGKETVVLRVPTGFVFYATNMSLVHVPYEKGLAFAMKEFQKYEEHRKELEMENASS